MFADEKGYLVTEMVWEEVTDDEAESPSKESKIAAAPKFKDEKPKVAPKKAPAPAAGSGQKSMMSFFTKK